MTINPFKLRRRLKNWQMLYSKQAVVGDIWSIPNYLSLSELTVASGVTHWQPLPPRPQD